MSIGLTELRQLRFADRMYDVLFPRAGHPRSETDGVYQFLWKQIVDQQLRPGDRVLDAAVAEQVGVSRTPVREAIQRLAQDGLLETLPRGVRVARMTAEAVEGLYDYRAALETFAARRAAPVLAVATVEGLLEEGEALRTRLLAPGGQHDPVVATDFLRYDLALHHLLLDRGGNAYFARAFAIIQARLSVFLVAGTRVPGRMPQSIDEHVRVLQALLAHDAAAAAEQMAAHITAARKFVLAHVVRAASEAPHSRRVRAGTRGGPRTEQTSA